MIIFLLIIFLLYLKKIFKFYRNKRIINDKKSIAFNKNYLNDWMNLTKKERYNLSKKESVSYLNKRKVLLEEIRKEYKRISKGDSEIT